MLDHTKSHTGPQLLDLLDPPVPTLDTASKFLFLDALLDIITMYLL